VPRRYGKSDLIEWRDGNSGQHRAGASWGAARSAGAATLPGRAPAAVAGGVPGEWHDAHGVRPAGGDALHDPLHVGGEGGQDGRARAAAGGARAFCGGGDAGERGGGVGSAAARRHAAAGRQRPGTGRAGAGRAGLSVDVGLPSFRADLRGGDPGGHPEVVQRAVGGGQRAAPGGPEVGCRVLLHQPEAHAAEAAVLGRHGRVGIGETIGAGSVLVAGAQRGEGEARPHAGGVGAAGGRGGPQARLAQGVV